MLLPISIVGALVLVSQGVDPELRRYATAHTLAGGTQTIALGPVASQEIIKELGTNGGGFFNVNSAMPFENPNGLSNFLEMLRDPADPGVADLHLRAHGRQPPPGLGDLRRDGDPVRRSASPSSTSPSSTARPAQHLAGVSTRHFGGSTGGNLEGKEQRFGIANSALWTAVTTVTSCGAVNAAFESLTGLGGARAVRQPRR